MHDPRFDNGIASRLLVEYSITRHEGRNVLLIERFDVPDEMPIPRWSGSAGMGPRQSFQIQHAPLAREVALRGGEHQLNLITQPHEQRA